MLAAYFVFAEKDGKKEVLENLTTVEAMQALRLYRGAGYTARVEGGPHVRQSPKPFGVIQVLR
jgi:hypothetical protein